MAFADPTDPHKYFCCLQMQQVPMKNWRLQVALDTAPHLRSDW